MVNRDFPTNKIGPQLTCTCTNFRTNFAVVETLKQNNKTFNNIKLFTNVLKNKLSFTDFLRVHFPLPPKLKRRKEGVIAVAV